MNITPISVSTQMKEKPVDNLSNTSFRACCGIEYSGIFNPKKEVCYAKVVDYILNSRAIKQFGEKYDFIVKIYADTYSPGEHGINVHLAPVPKVKDSRSSIAKFFSGIFKGSKSKADKDSGLNNETINQKNLPLEFCLCDSHLGSLSDVCNEIINVLRRMTGRMTAFGDYSPDNIYAPYLQRYCIEAKLINKLDKQHKKNEEEKKITEYLEKIGTTTKERGITIYEDLYNDI